MYPVDTDRLIQPYSQGNPRTQACLWEASLACIIDILHLKDLVWIGACRVKRRKHDIRELFQGINSTGSDDRAFLCHSASPTILDLGRSEYPVRGKIEKSHELQSMDSRRINRALRIRQALKSHLPRLRDILGPENIELSFAARHGFSTDSTGFRACTTEAVLSPPDISSMQSLIEWCYSNKVPLIPYGAGGGYNMGVVPMTPSVTVWSGCLGVIGDIIPYQGSGIRSRHAIWVDAGVSYRHLVDEIERRGYVIRCMPNTPRASVGGVVATGSNGGKRIAEIVIAGEAIIPDGRLVSFRTTDRERRFLKERSFPLVYKYHGIDDDEIRHIHSNLDSNPLPSSLFVAAEGTTGIITRVLLEVEEAPERALTAGIWFSDIDMVAPFVKAIHSLPEQLQPVYFELLTEPAITNYIGADFPDLFTGVEDAYVIVSFESDDDSTLITSREKTSASIPRNQRVKWIGPYNRRAVPPEARHLFEPREKLPTKMKSKCKADTEIELDFLPQAIQMLSREKSRDGESIESILFGHLSPPKSAILHWNIGGIDPSREETVIRAWKHLEQTLGDLMQSDETGRPRAAFTGEHGVAAKPHLLRTFLKRSELARQTRIKRRIDPRRIMNPYTLYLPTRFSRSLMATSLRFLPEPKLLSRNIRDLVLSCTRCNACQECLVINSQSEIRRNRSPRSSGGWLMGKRHLLQVLELLESGDIAPDTMKSIVESAIKPLRACISCGRCDKACPADIPLAALKKELWRLHGREPSPPVLLRLLYRLMLAPSPRSLLLWTQGIFMKLLRPMVARLNKLYPSHLSAYGALAPLSGSRYHPHESVPAIILDHDILLLGDEQDLPKGDIAIMRYKGCVGTQGHAASSIREDRFLIEQIGISFFDFRPDLCCGYPYQASGMYDKASKHRTELMNRLMKSAAYICQRYGYSGITVISACPTCQESLRTAGKEGSFTLPVSIGTPAEITLGFSGSIPVKTGDGSVIGLKVPCHATESSTMAQTRLLEMYGNTVIRLDDCCGMAGTGRIVHPEVGEVLAKRLSEKIEANSLSHIVSACPACRDGVELQRTLTGADFEITDLYEPLMGET